MELFTVSLDENGSLVVDTKDNSIKVGSQSSNGSVSFTMTGHNELKAPKPNKRKMNG